MNLRAGYISGQLGLVLTAALILHASGCAGPSPRGNLPPSASDLVLLKSARLCDQKEGSLQRWTGIPLRREPWGSGERVLIPADRSDSGSEETFFFDEDGMLVGGLFTYANGRNLKPYPVLRHTLSQLRPTLQFYLSVAGLPARANLDTSALYETGDEKSTTQYIVLEGTDYPTLLLASISLDPYSKLLSPYRQEFLARVGGGEKTKGAQASGKKGSDDKESFAALQQFARGEAAHLASCGARNEDIAVDAYRKAIAHGFSTNRVQLAEAHHKLGLALLAKGDFAQARAQMEQSLAVHPNRPEVLNNLGRVYYQLGDLTKAIATLEKAITIRPNYAMARFNLAEAYEAQSPKLAIEEYETYLALVEGIKEEADRAARARQRIRMLRR